MQLVTPMVLRTWMGSATFLLLAMLGGCGDGVTGGGGEGGEGEGGDGEGGSGGAPSVDCEPPPDAGAFEIGTGEACFERLASGDPMPHLNGPQGGYHLFLSLGCADCPAQIQVQARLLDPDTMEMLDRTWMTESGVTLKDGGGWPQAAGIQLSMPGLEWDPEYDPPIAEGTAFILDVHVTAGGAVLHDAQLPLVLGATEPWDPCTLHPEGECCQDDCI